LGDQQITLLRDRLAHPACNFQEHSKSDQLPAAPAAHDSALLRRIGVITPKFSIFTTRGYSQSAHVRRLDTLANRVGDSWLS
jgi:hypothetical protein